MLLPAVACNGDDTCGPGSAGTTGLIASDASVSLEYENLTGLLGNDCPVAGTPEGVISLSIEGHQVGGTGGRITFCIPRPDLLMEGDRTLGLALSSADVRLIDVGGTANSCTFAIDNASTPTGVARATGVCENGDAEAGFALTLDGSLGLRRTCGATVDTVQVTLRGTVAVFRR